MSTTPVETLSRGDFGTAAAADTAGGAPTLHVIIAHDDYAAYVRAMRMLANLFFGRAERPNCYLRTWRFEELGQELWRRRAAVEAPKVDVVVVSMSAAGELPDGVNFWLSDCLEQRRDMPTAVIALCEAVNDFELPWRRRLRVAATNAGLDFLEAGVATERKSA